MPKVFTSACPSHLTLPPSYLIAVLIMDSYERGGLFDIHYNIPLFFLATAAAATAAAAAAAAATAAAAADRCFSVIIGWVCSRCDSGRPVPSGSWSGSRRAGRPGGAGVVYRAIGLRPRAACGPANGGGGSDGRVAGARRSRVARLARLASGRANGALAGRGRHARRGRVRGVIAGKDLQEIRLAEMERGYSGSLDRSLGSKAASRWRRDGVVM